MVTAILGDFMNSISVCVSKGCVIKGAAKSNGGKDDLRSSGRGQNGTQ
jgi:hypothetical protein